MLQRYENMFGKLFWSHLIVLLTRVEKGFAETQFKEARKDVDIKRHLYASFSLSENEFDIPVIPIGLDNYDEAIEQLLAVVAATNKFECENIKSPLQELKVKETGLIVETQQAKQRVDHLNQQIHNIQVQINSL